MTTLFFQNVVLLFFLFFFLFGILCSAFFHSLTRKREKANYYCNKVYVFIVKIFKKFF